MRAVPRSSDSHNLLFHRKVQQLLDRVAPASIHRSRLIPPKYHA
jgi:hypothetical protein